MGINSQVKRPRSLVILVMLQVFQGLGLIFYSIYISRVYGWGFDRGEIQFLEIAPFELFDVISSGFLFVTLGVISLFLAFALWMVKRWAWIAAMALQGLSLSAALLGYIRQNPNYVSMVLGILLVFYLNQQDVQMAFRRKAERS